MNRKVKYALIIFGALGFIWALGNVTKALIMFSIPTVSNYPTLKEGDHFWASNIKKPKRFDFICFKTTDENNTDIVAVHRLVGLPGDIIEIRSSNLFVNGISRDKNLTLAKYYKVPINDEVLINEYEELLEGMYFPISRDTLLVNFSTNTIQKYQLKYPVFIDTVENPVISEIYGVQWTQDNFGPYKVPEDSYFVLGDNRHNSLDSRYLGPIPMENYVCTALFLK